jgi:hypothetical protein
MSNYVSPNSGQECSPAQYIAEIMCTREAAKQNITLPHKFWNQQPWKKKYANQIIAANGLLKVYDAEAIVRGINHPRISWAYSLRVRGLTDIIAEEQLKLDAQRKEAQKSSVVYTDNTLAKPAPQIGKKTIISKLD